MGRQVDMLKLFDTDVGLCGLLGTLWLVIWHIKVFLADVGVDDPVGCVAKLPPL